MSADSGLRERLLRETTAAALVASEREKEREPRAPEPADLFVLDDSADSLLEWVVLSKEPGDPPAVELIPADSLSLIGSGDVGAPGGDRSPLALRCRFPVQLPMAALDPHRRSGSVSRGTLESARAKCASIAAGEAVGTALERQVDADPEYQVWCEDVLEPARRSLLSSQGISAPSPSSPSLESRSSEGNVTPLRTASRKKAWWRRLEAPLALAATALLATSLALTTELRDLRSHNESLRESVRESSEAHLRELEAERFREARNLEARNADIARLQNVRDQQAREIETLRQRIQQPAPAPVQSLVNVPFAVLSPQTLRGSDDDLASLPLAEQVLLILRVDSTEPFERYSLEILEPGGEVIWKRSHLVLASRSSELTVVLPGALFRPGEYALALSGLRDGTVTDLPGYRLQIVGDSR